MDKNFVRYWGDLYCAQHANFYLVHSEQGNIVIDAGTHPVDLERAEQLLGAESD